MSGGRLGAIRLSRYGHPEKLTRCSACGDSQNPWHGHRWVQQDGLFYCYRCGASGYLPPDALRRIWPEGRTALMVPRVQQQRPLAAELAAYLSPGPGSTRKTRLDRYHIAVAEGLIDVFMSRDPRGRITGYHLRPSWIKAPWHVGARSLGYVGRVLDTGGTGYIRLVEGPYDVLEPGDVCTWGFPSSQQVRALRGYDVVLCPDRDVWENPALLRSYIQPFSSHRIRVLWVERLPQGALNPREIPSTERERLCLAEVLSLLR